MINICAISKRATTASLPHLFLLSVSGSHFQVLCMVPLKETLGLHLFNIFSALITIFLFPHFLYHQFLVSSSPLCQSARKLGVRYARKTSARCDLSISLFGSFVAAGFLLSTFSAASCGFWHTLVCLGWAGGVGYSLLTPAHNLQSVQTSPDPRHTDAAADIQP